jgi:AcrR family transcriptional regulator
MADTATDGPRRIGRPPKVDEFGVPTRERLLNAAVAACIEHGYEEATLSDIARRADVSTPAVYSHFSGKAELMIEASKQTLDKINADYLAPSSRSRNTIRAWMAPEAHEMRRMLLELHRGAAGHPELREMMEEWHRSHAANLQEQIPYEDAELKALYLFMMGMLHLEDMTALEADHEELVDVVIEATGHWPRSRIR